MEKQKVSVTAKIKGFWQNIRSMGKNLDPNVPLEKQNNVTLKEYIAIAVTKIGSQMIGITAGSYGAVFLYECFYGSKGITSADVASISAILTTITTILGYVIGAITATVAYKWKSKYGRYRQWYLLGLVPYILLNILAFIVPDFNREGLIGYKFAISIASTMLSGFYGISGNIVQVISPNPVEKKTVISAQQIFYYIGYGLAYVIPFFFGMVSSNKQAMYLFMILFASVITVAGSIMSFFWCRERIELPQKKKVKITGATIGLFKYKNYIIYHLIGYIGIFSMTGEMITYLTSIVVGTDNGILFALPSAIGTAVGIVICTFLFKKIEPVKILNIMGIYAPITACATFFSVYFTRNFSSILFFICYFFFGISFGLADMAKGHLDVEFNDFLEWKTGERVEAVQGVIPGWIGSGLSYGRSILIPFMLVWIGYETNTGSINLMEYMKAQPNYESTCLWLLAFALFGTALQYLLRAILLTFFYDIKGKNKIRMYEELSVLRAKRHQENLGEIPEQKEEACA